MTRSSQTEWHTIRPWSPRLVLSVREITSVSVTFILSSTFTGNPDPSLASLGLTPEDSESDQDGDDESESKTHAIIFDALAKGLSVNVNGSPWQRVLIRIDDKADEAVIIIYGLMAGRQYDIDLGLVQGRQNNSIRKHVITEISDNPNHDSQQDHEKSADHEHGHDVTDPFPSTSSTASLHPSSTSSSTSQSQSPNASPNSAHMSLEDRHHQLQHTLSLLTSERDSLTTSLKSARRDSQKADAALRSEIDVLKRGSEKYSAVEHRAKQKVLALQEAVKRAQITTKEMEEQMLELEAELPGLMEKRDEREAEYTKIKEEYDRLTREKEKEAENDRKRVEVMQNELTGLGNKLDRLNGKQEKLESGVIVDLEEQLREIEKEIKQIEADPYGYTSSASADSNGEVLDESIVHDGAGYATSGELYSTYLPVQKKRNQSVHLPGTIGRPSPSPIQRPSPPNAWVPLRPNLNQPTSTRSILAQQTHPHRQQPVAQSQTTSNSSATSSSPTISSSQTSTLSSRAAPFEPSRGISQVMRGSLPPNAGGSSLLKAPVPIQRPKMGNTAVSGNSKWGGSSAAPSGGYGFEGSR